MLNTVLSDMGGTLEDIWSNEEALSAAMEALQSMLRAAGLNKINPAMAPKAAREV